MVSRSLFTNHVCSVVGSPADVGRGPGRALHAATGAPRRRHRQQGQRRRGQRLDGVLRLGHHGDRGLGGRERVQAEGAEARGAPWSLIIFRTLYTQSFVPGDCSFQSSCL
jgi:hypothetical protein